MAKAHKRILLVDDEPDVLDALHDALNAYMADVEVVPVASGPDALRALRQDRFDIIVTDYRMSGMDGLEFLELAREVAPQVPRILVTAYPDLDLAIKALNKEHISHFITKPLRPRQITKAISAVFEETARKLERKKALAAALRAMKGETVASTEGLT